LIHVLTGWLFIIRNLVLVEKIKIFIVVLLIQIRRLFFLILNIILMILLLTHLIFLRILISRRILKFIDWKSIFLLGIPFYSCILLIFFLLTKILLMNILLKNLRIRIAVINRYFFRFKILINKINFFFIILIERVLNILCFNFHAAFLVLHRPWATSWLF
jgi:hypothetical protein